jgi:hypothetical protein
MSLFALAALASILAAEPAVDASPRATLDAWLAAQNRGAFEDYAALYASKILGVKRSGPRVRRMNREAWLHDRKRMFKKKMKVGVSDVVIRPAGGAANVSFVQRWESGKYKDQGPKRMLLVLEGGRFRIAQEEMLVSEIENEYVARAQAMLILDGVLVLTTKIDKSWAKGPATADGSYTGHRAVSQARLPEEFRKLASKAVEIFDAAGKRCVATVAGFELQARAEWHFGTLEEWKTTAKSTIATEVWAQARPLLVAHLKDKKGSCGKPVFGRVAGSSSAPVIPFREVKGAMLGQARAEGKAALANKARGEDLAGMTGFRLAKHDGDASQSLLFVSINPEECTPEATLSAELIWRLGLDREPASFTLLSSGDSDFRQALLAVDLDGDGRLEVIYEGWPREQIGIMTLRSPGEQRRVCVEIPYFDCPC